MKIIFDMDNTLTDSQGKNKRPNIEKLLTRLKSEGHELILWTNSPGFRAKEILKENELSKYFSQFIYREDYDSKNNGLNKDIRKIKGDIIIDDDPSEIKFNTSNKKKAILVKSFVSAKTVIDENEHEELYKKIVKRSSFFNLFIDKK